MTVTHGSFSKADCFGLQRQHLCDEQQGSHEGEIFAGKACIFQWLSSSVLPERNGKGHWKGGKCAATLNATESVLNRSWDSYHDLQLLITASVHISTFLTAHLSRYVYMQSELKKNTYTKHHMSIWRNVIKLNQVLNWFREKQKFERWNVKGCCLSFN